MTDDEDLENISEINVMKLDFFDIVIDSKLEIESRQIVLDEEIHKERIQIPAQDPIFETKSRKSLDFEIEELKLQAVRKRTGPILNSVTQMISIGTLFNYQSPN